MKKKWWGLAAGLLAGAIFLMATATGQHLVSVAVEQAGSEWSEATALMPQSPVTIPAEGSIEVAFSPPPGTTDAIVKAMGEAQHRLWIQAYSFTSAP
ncbi:MAG: phospholipase D family protein, partial [Acidithiobacillus sp.]